MHKVLDEDSAIEKENTVAREKKRRGDTPKRRGDTATRRRGEKDEVTSACPVFLSASPRPRVSASLLYLRVLSLFPSFRVSIGAFRSASLFGGLHFIFAGVFPENRQTLHALRRRSVLSLFVCDAALRAADQSC